ncbi:MAG: hypothetical protein R3C71_06290 [Candidatus Krumholzibacteriia bacterium]|nr:hypothetical protein [bacterium]
MQNLPLGFQPAEGGHSLVASLPDSVGIAEADQVALDLWVQSAGIPEEDDLLISIELVCSSGGQVWTLFESMDLFATTAAGLARNVLIDLSPVLLLVDPPCLLAGASIVVTPIAEGLDLSLVPEAGDAILQISRY